MVCFSGKHKKNGKKIVSCGYLRYMALCLVFLNNHSKSLRLRPPKMETTPWHICFARSELYAFILDTQCPPYKNQFCWTVWKLVLIQEFCCTRTEHEIFPANKYWNAKIFVGILIFISRKNFMLNWFEYEKMFYDLGAWFALGKKVA